MRFMSGIFIAGSSLFSFAARECLTLNAHHHAFLVMLFFLHTIKSNNQDKAAKESVDASEHQQTFFQG